MGGYRAGLQPAILYSRTTPRGRGVMQRCRLQRHCTSPPYLSTTDHYGSLSSRTALRRRWPYIGGCVPVCRKCQFRFRRCRWPCIGVCVPGLGGAQAATPLPDATFRRRVTDVEAVQSAMPVPGRGRISIAVGEEDEGRRTYGTRAHSTASPEGANIGQKTWPRDCFLPIEEKCRAQNRYIILTINYLSNYPQHYVKENTE